MSSHKGFSLVEALVAIAILGLAVLAALPAAATLRNSGRLAAGTRELALVLQATRWKSVVTRRTHGLWFREDERGWHWYLVQDGNGNGMRTAEIIAGTDRTLSGPHRLEQRVRGVSPGIPTTREYPAIPPATGHLSPADPVRFGRSDLVSFGPLGTSSSGTVYVNDGAEGLAAITVFGGTTRIRIRRFRAGKGSNSRPGQEGWTP